MCNVDSDDKGGGPYTTANSVRVMCLGTVRSQRAGGKLQVLPGINFRL